MPNEISSATPNLPALTPDTALALLKQSVLSSEILTAIGKNASVMKDRKVKLAVIQHPKTPRHVTLPLLPHLFTFDLMRIALAPAMTADLKIAADEALIRRLEKLSLGEKLSLARRASSRVASALLHDDAIRVVDTALNNGRLTEAVVVKETMKRNAGANLRKAVAGHPKWSLRIEVREALELRAPAELEAEGRVGDEENKDPSQCER